MQYDEIYYQNNVITGNTVVWEKFNGGNFHVKIFCVKIFSSILSSRRNFFNSEYVIIQLNYFPCMCAYYVCVLYSYALYFEAFTSNKNQTRASVRLH